MDVVTVRLSIADKDLYESYIRPSVENNELRGLVLQLLTMYFKNEELRQYVDGVSKEEIQQIQESDSLMASHIDRMQKAMATYSAMMDFAGADFANSMDEAVQMMNKMADVSGGTEGIETKFGFMPPEINPEVLIEKAENRELIPTANSAAVVAQPDNTETILDSYGERIKSLEGTINNLVSLITSGNVKVQPVVENASSIPVGQLVQKELTLTEVSKTNISENADNSEYIGVSQQPIITKTELSTDILPQEEPKTEQEVVPLQSATPDKLEELVDVAPVENTVEVPSNTEEQPKSDDSDLLSTLISGNMSIFGM